MHPLLLLLARILMAALFLSAGYQKLINPHGVHEFVQHLGLPGAAAYLVILLELGGGVLLIAGIYTRVVALLLAVFCLLTAFLVHYHSHNPGEMLQMLKDSCIAGGFLVLHVHGGGTLSLGHRLRLQWS